MRPTGPKMSLTRIAMMSEGLPLLLRNSLPAQSLFSHVYGLHEINIQTTLGEFGVDRSDYLSRRFE